MGKFIGTWKKKRTEKKWEKSEQKNKSIATDIRGNRQKYQNSMSI